MAVDNDDSVSALKFFKIILDPPRNDLQILGIPKKFMTDYGSVLENVVYFEIPTGKTWKVELVREYERGWFGEGWPEFVKYNSIGHGHFLMFSYDGNSRFKVRIFDMTASEIEYGFVPDGTGKEIQTIVSETKINKANLSSPSSSSKEMGMATMVRRYMMKHGTLTRKDIWKINARRFKNPGFAFLLKPSYVEYKFHATVPSAFANKYLKEEQVSCTLQNETGDTWRISIFSYRHFTKFKTGWKEFAGNNGLRVGDICVFELIDAEKCVFQVEIVRCSSGVDMTDCEIEYPFVDEETGKEFRKIVSETKKNKTTSSSKEMGIVASVRRYMAKHGTLTRNDMRKINARQFHKPSFTVLIQPSFLEHKFQATLPLAFTTDHLKDEQASCMLQNETGVTWPVGIVSYNPKYKQFKEKNWKGFARDNKLRVGDVCVFELINAEKCVFNVEILRFSSVGVDAHSRGPSTCKTSQDVGEKIEVILIEDD